MTDTDKELLELAAKAAGLDHPMWNEVHGYLMTGMGGDTREWNPLDDDGDAFRLAVKLNLTVVCEPHECEVFSEGECLVSEAIYRPSMVATMAEVTDPCAATRRAIVRAAATIAKESP